MPPQIKIRRVKANLQVTKAAEMVMIETAKEDEVERKDLVQESAEDHDHHVIEEKMTLEGSDVQDLLTEQGRGNVLEVHPLIKVKRKLLALNEKLPQDLVTSTR